LKYDEKEAREVGARGERAVLSPSAIARTQALAYDMARASQGRRLRGFGAPSASEVAELNAAMSSAISALRGTITKYKARIAGETALERLAMLFGPLGLAVQVFTSTDDAKRDLLGALNGTMTNIINRLDTSSRAEVLAGTLKPEKWVAAAKVVADGLTGIAKIYGDSTTLALLEATWVDFEKRTKVCTAGLLECFLGPWKWVVVPTAAVLVGLVGLGALRYITGYSVKDVVGTLPRRRKKEPA
jgi:hypothetical protein